MSVIVSVGEIVWDIFPERKVLGGAPVNVAYHLSTLGKQVQIITRVGREPLSEETLSQLISLGLNVIGVQRDPELPTGRVNVTVAENNEPHFDIVEPAAWDRIEYQAAAEVIAGREYRLIFGSLAQRHKESREAIALLRKGAVEKFYDVNLRPPFTPPEVVLESLKDADVVKMNGDELGQIGQWSGIAKKENKEIARSLLSIYDISVIAVTEGAKGAWVITAENYFHDPGSRVEVVDTVGAGDAFYAALIEGYLDRRPWPEILLKANKRGGYVASQPGATPPMPADL